MTDDREPIKIWVPGDPPEGPTLLSWIDERLAIGSYCQAAHRELMISEGIETVVSIGNLQPSYSADSGIHHDVFPLVEDCTDTFSSVEIRCVVTAIIEGSERGKTFVHCAAGVSRSPGFTTAALCHRDGLRWEEALEIVESGRPQTKVHRLIEKRLRSWLEDSNFDH